MRNPIKIIVESLFSHAFAQIKFPTFLGKSDRKISLKFACVLVNY